MIVCFSPTHEPERDEAVSERPEQLPLWIGRLLCRVGLHDFHLIEVVTGFGGSGQVEKYECSRCGHVIVRHG